MKARNMTREQVINDVMLAAQPTKQFVSVDQVAALAVVKDRLDDRALRGPILCLRAGHPLRRAIRRSECARIDAKATDPGVADIL